MHCESNLIIVQQDVTYSVYYFSVGSSIYIYIYIYIHTHTHTHTHTKIYIHNRH